MGSGVQRRARSVSRRCLKAEGMNENFQKDV